ncbi:MAG: four helix bundle protein [Bacteroidota bacterium]
MKHNFRKLSFWVKARILVKDIYQMTASFPKEEQWGITPQMRRAAVSVPANIAEGCGRDTDKQLIHFLSIANGSICELETFVYLAEDLKYITSQARSEHTQRIEEIRKMIMGFQRSLRKV